MKDHLFRLVCTLVITVCASWPLLVGLCVLQEFAYGRSFWAADGVRFSVGIWDGTVHLYAFRHFFDLGPLFWATALFSALAWIPAARCLKISHVSEKTA